MISIQQRRTDAAFLAAVMEMLVIVAACSLWAGLSGQIELLAAAMSASITVSGLLWLQWHRLKHGANSTFQPEMMPAIVMALVASRAVSAVLPETLSNIAMLSAEVLVALAVGGAMGFVLSQPVVRKLTFAAARSLL